jgi:hypothetical protein
MEQAHFNLKSGLTAELHRSPEERKYDRSLNINYQTSKNTGNISKFHYYWTLF